MRVKRIRISKKSPIKNFLRHYGVGGIENYSSEQVDALLRAFALLLDCTSYVELDQIARFLHQLTNCRPEVWEKAMEELEDYLPPRR